MVVGCAAVGVDPLMAYEFEREEHRCAVEAAADAGELDTYWWDRPSPGDFFEPEDNPEDDDE